MIKPEAKTIQEIVKANLCTACGTCAGICPQSAIDLVVDNKRGIYVPKIYPNKCSLCGTCIACCPGGSLNVDHLNLEIFGVQPDNVLVGNHANCYTGHSTSHEIRYSSSSGGLITELLIFALKNKLIDGVIVTKMNASDPLRPEPFLAKTKEEIVSASKSKYCPIPVNTMLKEILKTEGRFAVVGLPCHIHGIRKAMKVNKKLSERIVLIFGLMCSFNRNFLATEFILQRLSIKKEEIIQLDYRGKGYMGNLSVSLRNGQVFSVPYLEYNQWLRSFFSITRCFLCIDHTCEFADISFGDNCLPQFRKESIGSSILISRTQRGEQLLASARTADRIELTEVSLNEVVRSKKGSLIRKKNFFRARKSIYRVLRKRTPIYNIQIQKCGPLAYLNALSTYLQIYISKKRRLWRFLAPLSIILKKIS